MNEAQSILVDLISTNSLTHDEVHRLCQELPESTDQDMLIFLHQLVQLTAAGEADEDAWETILASCEAWARRRVEAEPGSTLPDSASEWIGIIYSQLGPAHAARYHLLSMLAIVGQATELAIFCQLLRNDPPQGLAAATAPFFPLLADHVDVSLLFPALLDCLDNQDIAVAVLEIANHFTRDKRLVQHPGSQRSDRLIDLLGGVTQQLERLQQQAMDRLEDDNADRRQTVSNGISLAVALCDAVGLIGDARAVGPLKCLMGIKHRRVRVEAAAALARLGQIEGKNVLKDLAAEPSVRLRVLAYADELDFIDRIDERYSAPAAVAEAELVTYLARPTNMGVPPSACELTDARTLYWPGFEEPRNCYLFRFTYHAAEPDGTLSTFRNLGIAGPLVHAFHQSLEDLTLTDAYAAFAGWQAEHDDILQFDIDQVAGDAFHPVLLEHIDRLEHSDYSETQPVIHGKFFGDDLLVARCQRDNTSGAVVVDAQSESWYPAVDPGLAYSIYKGHRLLQAFNDDFGA